jgi:hypothetical protein
LLILSKFCTFLPVLHGFIRLLINSDRFRWPTLTFRLKVSRYLTTLLYVLLLLVFYICLRHLEGGAYELAGKKCAPFPREVRTSLLKGAHFLSLSLPTFFSPLAQRRHFCCATKQAALRNGATFVAQQKSATPLYIINSDRLSMPMLSATCYDIR